MNTDRADVAIVTIIDVELAALLRQLGTVEEVLQPEDQRLYYRARVRSATGDDHEVVCTKALHQGSSSVVSAVLAVFARWTPDVLLLVGIGGSIRDDVDIGDVVIASQIFYYDLGKVTDIGTKRRLETYRPLAFLVRAAESVRGDSWVEPIGKAPLPGITRLPQRVIAPLGSGEKVIASVDAKELAFLREVNDKVAAVDMEAGGFASALDELGLASGLVIRGMSDRADREKHDGYQAYAASSAAAFAVAMLARLSRRRRISEPREGAASETRPSSRAAPSIRLKASKGVRWNASVDTETRTTTSVSGGEQGSSLVKERIQRELVVTCQEARSQMVTLLVEEVSYRHRRTTDAEGSILTEMVLARRGPDGTVTIAEDSASRDGWPLSTSDDLTDTARERLGRAYELVIASDSSFLSSRLFGDLLTANSRDKESNQLRADIAWLTSADEVARHLVTELFPELPGERVDGAVPWTTVRSFPIMTVNITARGTASVMSATESFLRIEEKGVHEVTGSQFEAVIARLIRAKGLPEPRVEVTIVGTPSYEQHSVFDTAASWPQSMSNHMQGIHLAVALHPATDDDSESVMLDLEVDVTVHSAWKRAD